MDAGKAAAKTFRPAYYNALIWSFGFLASLPCHGDDHQYHEGLRFGVAYIVFPWEPGYIHLYFQLHLVDSRSRAQNSHTG